LQLRLKSFYINNIFHLFCLFIYIIFREVACEVCSAGYYRASPPSFVRSETEDETEKEEEGGKEEGYVLPCLPCIAGTYKAKESDGKADECVPCELCEKKNKRKYFEYYLNVGKFSEIWKVEVLIFF
jgi:hypothetical protein